MSREKALKSTGWINRWWNSKQQRKWKNHSHRQQRGGNLRDIRIRSEYSICNQNQSRLNHAVQGGAHTLLVTPQRKARKWLAPNPGPCGELWEGSSGRGAAGWRSWQCAWSGFRLYIWLLALCTFLFVCHRSQFYDKATIKLSPEGSQEKCSARMR